MRSTNGETIGSVREMSRREAPGRASRVAWLLLTIGALVFVGMQSRVAQSIPSRSPKDLLPSLSDPVKVPPPEEKSVGTGLVLMPAVGALVLDAPPILREESPRSTDYESERPASATLLRAPPASL